MATMNGAKFTLTCNVSQKQDAKGNKVNERPLTVTFDFAGVSTSQLQTEAARAIIVKLAGKLRSSTTRKDKPMSWDAAIKSVNNSTIKVADFLKDTRSRKTPEQRFQSAKKDAARLDDAAKKKLAAELLASIGK